VRLGPLVCAVTGIVGAVSANSGGKFGFRIAGIISHCFFRPHKFAFDFSTMNVILERDETQDFVIQRGS
jgi:hypothetical protein